MERVQAIWTGFGLVATGGLLGLLALKVFWNFGTAYVLIHRARKQLDGQPVSISLHPLLDVFLLIAAVLTSIATLQEGIFRPTHVAVWGTAAVVASYLHLVIVSFVFGGLRRVFSNRRR